MRRKLRIVFSAVCAICCLLLIVLWWRSYRYLDVVRGPLPGSRAIQLISSKGRLRLIEFSAPPSIGWRRSSLHHGQLDQQMVQAFEADPQLQILQQHSMSLLALKMQNDANQRRGASRDTAALERTIEQIDRQAKQYREQATQQMLRDFGAGIWTTPASRFGFDFRSFAQGSALELPHWFVVVLGGASAAIAGVGRRWRYSLRTLLIATTLIAVVLGSVLHATR